MSKEQERRNRREWTFLGLQLVPLIVMMMTIVACGSGGDDLGGLGYTIGSDVFLNGFLENSNDNFFDTSIQPIVTNENVARESGACAAITYPEIFARLTVRNGIGVVIEQIAVEFTETSGQPLVDLSSGIPISRAGEFDFVINTALSFAAAPIATSPSAAFVEPAGNTTTISIPVQLYQTQIFCGFQINQPSPRPLLAKITFRGIDILGNRFTLVGYQIMSTLVTIRASS